MCGRGRAVPRGQIEDLDVGCGEGERLIEGSGATVIARDVHEDDRSLLGVASERVRKIGDAERVEAFRHGR